MTKKELIRICRNTFAASFWNNVRSLCYKRPDGSVRWVSSRQERHMLTEGKENINWVAIILHRSAEFKRIHGIWSDDMYVSIYASLRFYVSLASGSPSQRQCTFGLQIQPGWARKNIASSRWWSQLIMCHNVVLGVSVVSRRVVDAECNSQDLVVYERHIRVSA